MGMATLDLGIGTQIIPVYELSDILEMEESQLVTICKAGGLNLIKKGDTHWVGMWQFRLFMTHLLGFGGKVWNFNDDDPSIPRVTPDDIRVALSHLVIAKSVQKGELVQSLPKLQERAARRWASALDIVPKALTEKAMSALEAKGLLDAARHATPDKPD